MRQIFLEIGLQSWLKASFVALVLLSSSRASKFLSGTNYSYNFILVSFMHCRYGIGYHLTVVKENLCDSSKIEQLIKSLVPKAEQVTDVGADLSYILPSSATPSFPELFDRLETERKALGIVSFGVSVTTMEEVFMKVGEGATDATLNDQYVQ